MRAGLNSQAQSIATLTVEKDEFSSQPVLNPKKKVHKVSNSSPQPYKEVKGIIILQKVK